MRFKYAHPTCYSLTVILSFVWRCYCNNLLQMRVTGLEPACLATLEPKSSVSAISTIPAYATKTFTLWNETNLQSPGYKREDFEGTFQVHAQT